MKLIKPAAWNHGRSVSFLLLFLLFLTSWRVESAHADGVNSKITNGKTVNGTLSGKGFDTYTFKVTAGSSFIVSVGETGTHNPTFVPRIDLAAPGSSGNGVGRGGESTHPLYARLEQDNAAEGTWTVKVSRGDKGTARGTYALRLVQAPGAMTGGIAAVAMSPGGSYSGSNTRGKIDVFTFAGVAGHTETLTLKATGGAGFIPEVFVISPTGDSAGSTWCSTSCFQDFLVTAGGTWTVFVTKQDDNDVTGAYALSVNDK